MKEKIKKTNKDKKNIIKRIITIALCLIIAIFVLIKGENYLKDKKETKVNLIINNNNVTTRLKNEVKIEDGIIYLSVDDIKNISIIKKYTI